MSENPLGHSSLMAEMVGIRCATRRSISGKNIAYPKRKVQRSYGAT
jgi:hypothetical protein